MPDAEQVPERQQLVRARVLEQLSVQEPVPPVPVPVPPVQLLLEPRWRHHNRQLQ